MCCGRCSCAVFLGARGSYYDMESKYARMTAGANPFIDPQGLPMWESVVFTSLGNSRVDEIDSCYCFVLQI